MRVLLRSSLRSDTERGGDTFELLAEFIKLGVEVYLSPTDIRPPVPSLIAATLTKPYPPHFDMILNYVNPSDIEVREFRDLTDMNVLWTSHPTTMFNTANKKLGPTLQNYDAILAQDDVTYGALQPLLEREPVPLGVLAPGYSSASWSPERRDWTQGSGFRFIMVLNGDKGEYPEVAIEAFHKLKTGADQLNPGYPEFEDVELVIKTTLEDDLNLNLMDHVPGLTIIKANWAKDTFRSFYRDSHCLISSDRGGVRNKAALEFLSTGGTAIATDWSLNKSWLTSGWGYPLKYDYTSVSHKDSRNKFAAPSSYDLQELMLDVVQNRFSTSMAKGQLASQVIPAMLDWSKVLNSMFLMLDELVPGEGSNLYEKYMRCEPMKEETPSWKM